MVWFQFEGTSKGHLPLDKVAQSKVSILYYMAHQGLESGWEQKHMYFKFRAGRR